MTRLRENILDDMVHAIVREVDPEYIFVFGSHARGRVGPGSDVDLLIVEREPFGKEMNSTSAAPIPPALDSGSTKKTH